MVREVAAKASEQAGDGTTTATILVHELSAKEPGRSRRMNPMDLKPTSMSVKLSVIEG